MSKAVMHCPVSVEVYDSVTHESKGFKGPCGKTATIPLGGVICPMSLDYDCVHVNAKVNSESTNADKIHRSQHAGRLRIARAGLNPILSGYDRSSAAHRVENAVRELRDKP